MSKKCSTWMDGSLSMQIVVISMVGVVSVTKVLVEATVER